jgi:hypothetical protein
MLLSAGRLRSVGQFGFGPLGGTHMNRTFCWGFALLAFVALNSDMARAQKADEDGPSRSQLFSLFVRAPAEADLGILGSALPFSFRFPLHVRNDSVFGIDVSHHNEDFAIARSIGMSSPIRRLPI